MHRTLPLFVALEPDEALAAQVAAYKRRLAACAGEQLFGDHSPHLTLYLACFDENALGAVESALASISHKLAAAPARLHSWHVFPNDPLTGNHTLVLDPSREASSILRRQQRRVVAALAPLRNDAACRARYAGRMAALARGEQDAIAAAGFPYLGRRWRPHVTIASVRPVDWPIVESEFLGDSPRLEGHFTYIALYRLEEERPALVRRFPLAVRRQREAVPPAALSPGDLRQAIIDALRQCAERLDWIDSATIAGSFVQADVLAAVSDIDFVVVVDRLDVERFGVLQLACQEALEPILARAGYALRINPTLGPLKFDDPATAVLHLMIYSRAAHESHAIHSPFTCRDWQRSRLWFKRPLVDVYPTFALAPRHFISARRSPRDYLADYRAGRITYRELECTATGYREVCRQLPMGDRDRMEFAWHIVRFLMQNLLKLVHRNNRALEGSALCEAYLGEFSDDAGAVRSLFAELEACKKSRQFAHTPERLGLRLEEFVAGFVRQFRQAFFERATRHLAFRHARTAWNRNEGEHRRFVGRTDAPIEPAGEEALACLQSHLAGGDWSAAFVSPLSRCRQSFEIAASRAVATPAATDRRLLEIDYGECEGLTVAQARARFPDLFAAWARGEDPRFPRGESNGEVAGRVHSFIEDRWREAAGDTVMCTHNGVLRVLLGLAMGVPPRLWHRLRVGHLQPLGFIYSRRYGLFADLDEAVQRDVMADFSPTRAEASNPAPEPRQPAPAAAIRKSA